MSKNIDNQGKARPGVRSLGNTTESKAERQRKELTRSTFANVASGIEEITLATALETVNGMMEDLFCEVDFNGNFLTQPAFGMAVSEAASSGARKQDFINFFQSVGNNTRAERVYTEGGAIKSRGVKVFQFPGVLNDPSFRQSFIAGSTATAAEIDNKERDEDAEEKLYAKFATWLEEDQGTGTYRIVRVEKLVKPSQRRDVTIKARFMALLPKQRQRRTILVESGGSGKDWAFTCNGVRGAHLNRTEAKWLAILNSLNY
jgi:hypothetical protein